MGRMADARKRARQKGAGAPTPPREREAPPAPPEPTFTTIPLPAPLPSPLVVTDPPETRDRAGSGGPRVGLPAPGRAGRSLGPGEGRRVGSAVLAAPRPPPPAPRPPAPAGR